MKPAALNTILNPPDGDVNYIISRIVAGVFLDEKRYFNLERAIGTFECAKLELYRRLGTFMEDRAIDKNSDIQEYKGIQ